MPPAPVRTDELLVQAASRGEVDRVRALLDHGAVAAGRNHYLLTALHWAVTLGHTEVVQLLLDRGADLNARSRDGHTPLHMAAREGDPAMTALLLAAGADTELRNNQQQTALDLALTFAEDEPDVAHALRRAQVDRAARLQQAGSANDRPTVLASSGGPAASAAATHSASVGCGPDASDGARGLPTKHRGVVVVFEQEGQEGGGGALSGGGGPPPPAAAAPVDGLTGAFAQMAQELARPSAPLVPAAATKARAAGAVVDGGGGDDLPPGAADAIGRMAAALGL